MCREIIHAAFAAVLSGNNMLDVMQEFAIALVKPAILAPLPGTLPDQAPGSGINHQ
jgi:hypothetical protein